MRDIKPLLPFYDALAWVPTIRGSLSLDLFETSSGNNGDVDRYAISIKRHIGNHTCHYLAATSLEAVVDKKLSSDYCSTFRTFFVGTINDDVEQRDLLLDSGLADNLDVTHLLRTDGVLLGKVIIVTETSYRLTDLETLIIRGFKALKKQKAQYLKAYSESAEETTYLDNRATNMFHRWESLRTSILNLENEIERPIFTFNVLLTRDGILLIKNITSDTYLSAFYEKDTAMDYTKCVPLPRIFKYVMNYVKFVFHANYHHKEKHDTFLPTANLHPLINSQDVTTYNIFRYLMNSLLCPITKLKRSRYKAYTLDPNGVMYYAKSMARVFYNNGLIDKTQFDEQEAYLKIQEEEINHMTQANKSLVSAFNAQRNIVFILSGVLAILVALIKIVTTYFKLPYVDINGENVKMAMQWHDVAPYFFGTLIVGLILWVLFDTVQTMFLRKRFAPSRKSEIWETIFFHNSYLDYKIFSVPYIVYLWSVKTKLLRKKVLRQIFYGLFMISILFVIIWCMIKLV